MTSEKPLVAVLMGSKSDYDIMQHCCQTLADFGIPYEARVISAHRSPDLMLDYASKAESRGLLAIIAGAGAAAHVAGMVAALTFVPVLGVPLSGTPLVGTDALLSMVQMPAGVPVGTLAIGKPGAINAAIFAAEIVAQHRPEVKDRLRTFRQKRRDEVAAITLPAPAV
jgi:5-(carboxyamino)imidazole ribonucleotide mutase